MPVGLFWRSAEEAAPPGLGGEASGAFALSVELFLQVIGAFALAGEVFAEGAFGPLGELQAGFEVGGLGGARFEA